MSHHNLLRKQVTDLQNLWANNSKRSQKRSQLLKCSKRFNINVSSNEIVIIQQTLPSHTESDG